jgi:hypothetical protein
MRFGTNAGGGEADKRATAARCSRCRGDLFQIFYRGGWERTPCCAACGSTSWPSAGRGSRKDAGGDKAVGGAGDGAGDVVCEEKGGKAKPWVKAGVHRSTWYRRVGRIATMLGELQDLANTAAATEGGGKHVRGEDRGPGSDS